MNMWCGGSDSDHELASFADRTAGVLPIGPAEYLARRAGLVEAMRRTGVATVYLDATHNLTYFTG